MFDVIGKRRWFYLLSLIITIPGLVFILLTPFTDAGLQFTIDYTGGTSGRSASRTRTSRPTRSRLSSPSRASMRSRSRPAPDFIEIKTEQLTDLQQPEPVREPGAIARRPRAGRRARVAGASAAPAPAPRRAAARPPSASPAPSASPVRVTRSVGLARRVAGPLGVARRPPTGNTKIPTEGKLGEVAVALQDELGPIAEQRSLTTIGAVVSSDLISPGPDPHRGRVARDHGLDHLPVPRRGSSA